MANESKTYLINFKDNLDQYAKNAKNASLEVERLSVANQQLKEDENASYEEIIKSNAALKNAQTEYKNATKNVEIATKARDAEIGSYDKLYNQWKLAQTQLKLVANQYTTNSAGVRVLSEDFVKQSKVVADAKASLDAFGKGVHDNRLNVGSYSEALEGAIGGLEQMPGAFGGAVGGAKALLKQLWLLVANPIGAIIAAIALALMALYKAFTSTDSGATEMAARLEQLKAIIDVLRQRVISLIGVFKAIFKGDWKGAGEQMKATFTGIGDQLKAATKAAYDYQYALDAIEDSQNNFISKSADMRNAIAKLEYSAADRTKSTTERKKALEEALKLGAQLVEIEKKHAEDRLNTEADYLAGKAGLRREDVIAFVKMTDEEQATASVALKSLRDNNDVKFKEIEELYGKAIDLDTKFFEENKRNASKLSGFILEISKEEKERLESQRVENLRKQTDAAVTEMKLLLSNNDAANKSRLDAHVATTQKMESVDDMYQQRKLERIQIEYDAANAVLEMSLFGQLQLERNKLDAEYQMKMDAANRVNADTTDIEQQHSMARRAIANAERDAKLALVQGLASDIISAVGEQSAIGKAAAIAQTLITTYQSATGAFASFTAPPAAGVASVPLGLVAAAAAVAAGLANVKKIMSVKLPKGAGSGGSSASVSGSSMSSAAARVTAKPLGATTLQPVTSAAEIVKMNTQNNLSADTIAAAVGKLPPPVVTVEDINAKTGDVKKVEIKANI